MREWEVWDAARGQSYVKNYGTPHAPTKDHAARMRAAASLVVGNSVLDVGCGVGHLYPHVRDCVTTYVGVDTSYDMLALARKFNPDGRFVYGDVYDLSDLGEFDTVCCVSIYIHLPDLQKPMQQSWDRAKNALVFTLPIADKPVVERIDCAQGVLLCRRESEASLQGYIDALDPKPVGIYRHVFHVGSKSWPHNLVRLLRESDR